MIQTPIHPSKNTLKLSLRSSVEIFKGSDAWEEVVFTREFPVTETAILICDMWDRHWCEGAASRVDAMAPKMNKVIAFARNRGLQVIHAPSDTMKFYAKTKPRIRAQSLPRIQPPAPLSIAEGPMPITVDDDDGGCDTGQRPTHRPWTRQHPAIEIHDEDILSDDGTEVYSFLKSRQIETLLYMGVHTNMCVLGRSFGIRQMTRWGIRCILMRDMTDAMYNPASPPHVTHDQGTELVVEHIERFWCPSVLSRDIV